MMYSEGTNREEFKVAIPENLNARLLSYLLRDDGQEDAIFALYQPSLGKISFNSLIYEIVPPLEGERTVHGNVEISQKYFRRVCAIAIEKKAGIVLLHSHLGPGWQGMSIDDIKTERSYSSPCLTFTELPIVGLTLGTDGTWSARIWEYNNDWHERKMASVVKVIGKKMKVFINDSLRPRPVYKEMYKRTINVWGEENHATLARLRVGIVGLGSVGSMVGEALARMGIERFVLIDFDEVQEHNLDRLNGATVTDIGTQKVYISHRQIIKTATANVPQVSMVPYGITEQEGYLNALDCDVLFSCVDRPWPRSVLNHIAYNHLIPIIDGGVKVRFNTETHHFDGADWQALAIGPDRICLECAGQYHMADVSTEREGLLENPSYLEGLPRDHSFKSNENVFPFSMNLASMEVLQFVEMITGVGNGGYFGTQRYMYNHGYIRLDSEAKCVDDCLYKSHIGYGDSVFPPPIGRDRSAENARNRQSM